MPAQTHGRARNGFHIFATSSSFKKNLNPPPCDTTAACDKSYCCGPAIQPLVCSREDVNGEDYVHLLPIEEEKEP